MKAAFERQPRKEPFRPFKKFEEIEVDRSRIGQPVGALEQFTVPSAASEVAKAPCAKRALTLSNPFKRAAWNSISHRPLEKPLRSSSPIVFSEFNPSRFFNLPIR